MTKYNVIWIDDEYEQNPYFVSNAVEKGINIVGYKSAKEGIEALKANFEKWDAIILDANCLLDSIDKSPDVDSLEYSTTNINTLFLMKKEEIPVFILSGYKDFLENNMARKWVKKYKIFHKTDVTDNEDNLNSFYDKIIEKVENSNRIETFVRRNYAEILNDNSEYETTLTNILVAYEKKENLKNNYGVLTEIRGILEQIRHPLSKIYLIDDPESSISWVFKYWDNDEMNFIPIYIRETFRKLVNVTNGASHHDKSPTQKDISDGKAPHLVESCILDLLTILRWFNKELPISPNDIERYKDIAEKIKNKSIKKAGKNLKYIEIEGRVKIMNNEYCLIIKKGLRLDDDGKNFKGSISKFW